MQGRLDFTVTTTYVTRSTSQGRPPFDTPHGRGGLYVGAHCPSPFLPLFSSPPRFIDPQPTGFQCQSRGHCPTPTPPTPNVPRMLILTYLQAPDPRPCMQQRQCGAPAQMDMLSEAYCVAVGGHAVPAPLVSISLSCVYIAQLCLYRSVGRVMRRGVAPLSNPHLLVVLTYIQSMRQAWRLTAHGGGGTGRRIQRRHWVVTALATCRCRVYA